VHHCKSTAGGSLETIAVAKKKSQPASQPEGELEQQLDSLAAEARSDPATESQANADADDLSGDALADQIQDLLNDAKQGASGATASEPFKRATAATASASQDTVVQHLDSLLAADADDAVAGDFETTSEIADEPGGGGMIEPEGDADGKDDKQTEPDLEGAFTTPEELLQAEDAAAEPEESERAHASSFNADAKAVARELDAQPEKAAAVAVAEKPQRAAEREPVEEVESAKPRKPRPGPSLRGMLVAINRPLLNCSKQTRNLVGWIGLLTLFNGSILMMGRMVFHIAGPSASTHQSTEESKPAAHGEAAAEGGHAKEPAHGEEGGHEPKHDAKPKPKPHAGAAKPSKKPAAAAHEGH
jgi:hypothetical protein